MEAIETPSVEDPHPIADATSARLDRIYADFRMAFDTVENIGPAVSVFGSARIKPDHPWYALGEQLGAALARTGHAVITGGGPGLMEAANSGADAAGGHSVGLGIELPFESGLNPYVHTGVIHRYFFVRKLLFLRSCRGLVALPGGLGTLDELFETLTMMQTGRTAARPVALIGVEYWSGLMDWMRGQMLANGLIKEGDIDRILLSDDIDEVVAHVTQGTFNHADR